jgi:hypothetical protein
VIVVELRGAVAAAEPDELDRGRVVLVVDVLDAAVPSKEPPVGVELLDLAPASRGWPKSAAKAPTARTAPPAIHTVALRTVLRPRSRPLRVFIGVEPRRRSHEEPSGSPRIR